MDVPIQKGEVACQTKLMTNTTDTLTQDTNHCDEPSSLQKSASSLLVTVTSELTSNSSSEKKSDPTLEETSSTEMLPVMVETDSVISETDATSKSVAVPLTDDVSIDMSEKVNGSIEEEMALGKPVSPKGDAILVSSNKSTLPSSDETISVEEMFQVNTVVVCESSDETTMKESVAPLKTDATCSEESNTKVTQDDGLMLSPLDLSINSKTATSLTNTDSAQSLLSDVSSVQSNSSTAIVVNSPMETDSMSIVEAVLAPSMKLDAVSSAEATSSSPTESNSASSVEVVSTPSSNGETVIAVKAAPSPASTDGKQSDATSVNVLATSDVSLVQSAFTPIQDGQTSNQSLSKISAAANGNNMPHDNSCPRIESSENKKTAPISTDVASGVVDQDIMVMDVVGANEYRETPIVIGDSEGESWTSDSEEDSSSEEEVQAKKPVESSSSSDSSSDEEEDEEDLKQKQARLKQKELTFKKNQTKRDSKNCRLPKELLLTDLPCIEDLLISVPEEEAQAIGEVTGIVEELVIVEAYDNLRPIDLDSVLFLKQGSEALGQVFDVFGCVKKPSYTVRFNTKDHIVQRGISVGDQVYFAPRTDHCKFVDVEDLMRYRGSDASWEHDKEPPSTCVDFSDDEEEQVGRRTKKNLTRTLDKTMPSYRESVQKKPRTDNYFSRSSDQQHRNRQPYQQSNNNNNWNNRNGSQEANRWNNQGASHSSTFGQPFANGRQEGSYGFPSSVRQNNFGNAGNGQQPPSANHFYSSPPTPTSSYFAGPPPCPSPLSGVPPPSMSPMSMPPPAPSPHPVCPSPTPWDTAPFLPSTIAPPPHVMRPPHPPLPTAGHPHPPLPTAGHPPMNQGPAFFPSSYGNTHNEPNSGANVQFSRPPPSGHFTTQEQTSASSLWRSVSNPNLNQWSQPPPSQHQNGNQSFQPMTSSPVKFGSAANLNSLDMSRPPPCNPASFGSAAQFPRFFPNSGESNASSARDFYQNAASVVNAPCPPVFFNQPPPPGVNFQQNSPMMPNAFASIPPPPPPERNRESGHGSGPQFSQMNFGNQGY